MKKMNLNSISSAFLLFVLLTGFGCTSRIESPVTDEDLTIIYPPKKPDDISAKITLCRKTDKETGERIGSGTVFTIMERGRIQAFADLQNRFSNNKRELMFHFDWIGANGKSLFLKRIDLSPDDSTSTIKSSISISPETRQPGEYILQLYFFRELIAEKKFELIPEFQLTDFNNSGLFTDIILYSKTNRKTGKRIGVDSVFTIKRKRKVRAFFDLKNRVEYGHRELLFRFEWIGPNGKSFFKKQIDLSPDDTATAIYSSISITPEKRQPGEYRLRLYLFNVLISEKKFDLIPK